MFVVMSLGATEEQLNAVRSLILEEGLTPHENRGGARIVIAVLGEGGAWLDRLGDRLSVAAGRRVGDADQSPVQADVARVPPRGHGRPGRRRRDRRRLARRSWPARAPSSRASSCSRPRTRSRRPARPCCAAARSSRGPARTRSRAWASQGLRLLAEARERTGPAGGHRGDGAGPGRARRRVRRHPPDRRPQHAELLAPHGGRPDRPAGPPQARPRRARSRSGSWPPSTSCSSGNPNVILCERGIRTFETATRATRSTSPPCRCCTS